MVGACGIGRRVNEKKRQVNGKRDSRKPGTQAVIGRMRTSGRFESRGWSKECQGRAQGECGA